MRKLILATVAAGLSTTANAAPIVRDGPNPVPSVSLRKPIASGASQAGTTWQTPAEPMRASTMRSGTTQRPMQGMAGANRYRGYRQISRGGTVPGYWSAPEYGINNYGHYGFAQPLAGTRWVRYYDDALLVDTNGRVYDGRYGMDFDRYGDRWGRDRRGVPIYVGDGEFRTQDRDYALAERLEREGSGRLAYDRDYPYDAPYRGQGRSDQGRSAEGYDDDGYDDRDYAEGNHGNAGYGYGSGYRPGYVMVTETVTTTTSPSTVRYVQRPVTVHRPQRRRGR